MRFGLDVAQQRMPWDELVSRVQFAEELGFDGAWGFDHFQPMYGDGPGEVFDGMTTLAALAGTAATHIRTLARACVSFMRCSLAERSDPRKRRSSAHAELHALVAPLCVECRQCVLSHLIEREAQSCGA